MKNDEENRPTYEEPPTTSSQQQKQCIPKTSKSRYQMFTTILHRSLTESHKAVDLMKVINDCYGEDVSLFADTKAEGNNLLVGLLERALEQIDDDMKREMEAFLVREQAKIKLDRFDAAIRDVSTKERMVKEAEEYDKQSARDAVQNTKMPEGVTMNDVITYRTFLLKQKEKEDLLAKIKGEQDEAAILEEQLKKQVEKFESGVNEMTETGKALEEIADMCSNVQSGDK